ncbi:hypothetical protein RHO15_09770 [Utexia brackfieldae]|uniref:hypothetical protein n=1 Tax=Utexia brackfieldae TaxID=3074108 RepID=UPI00370D706A
MRKYQYVIHGKKFDYVTKINLNLNYKWERNNLVELIAEDFYNRHKGWQELYPTELVLMHKNIKIGTFRIERRYSAVFSTQQIE